MFERFYSYIHESHFAKLGACRELYVFYANPRKVKIEQTPTKRKRASFFGSWEKYTEAENDEYCRLNNRAVSTDTKTVEIIDLDEYEKEQMKQQVRTKQRAKHGKCSLKLIFILLVPL